MIDQHAKITFAIDSGVNFTPIYDLIRNFTSVFLKFYTLITTNHTSKNSIFVFRKVKTPQKSFEIAQNHITRGKNRWRIDWRGYFGIKINEKIQNLAFFEILQYGRMVHFSESIFSKKKAFSTRIFLRNVFKIA